MVILIKILIHVLVLVDVLVVVLAVAVAVAVGSCWLLFCSSRLSAAFAIISRMIFGGGVTIVVCGVITTDK
jgi:hypothetical protein